MDELKNEFESDYDVDDSDDENWKMIAQGQSITIPAGDIEQEPEGPYRVYNIGDIVTFAEENFYVIEKSNSNSNKLKLLASKNVNTSTNKQDDNANTVAFDDNDGTIYAESSIKSFVDSYVQNLISKGIKLENANENGDKGRLMSIEEVKSFGVGTDTSVYFSGFYTTNAPAFINATEYWLETPNEELEGEVYSIHTTTITTELGEGKKQIASSGPSWFDWSYGVRPVLVILKDNLQ